MIIDFSSKIDAAWLDGVIAGSLEEDGPLTLRLRAWEDMQIFAEGRLLQWMQQLRQQGRVVHIELEAHLPTIEDDPQHGLWELFRKRLGAMLLIDAAAEVRDAAGLDRRAEIDSVQAAVLRAEGGEVGFGRERTLLRRDTLTAPPSFPAFVKDEKAFEGLENRIDRVVKKLNLALVGEVLEELTSFVYELIANTRMHARDDLNENPIEGLRFLQFRRLRIDRQRNMEQLPVGDGPLQAYLQRLANSAVLDEEAARTFVEVTIADSGVGIPGRLRRSMDVYLGPLAEERKATLEAILTDASSRPGSVMGKGQGLDTAIEMAQLLHGLVAIRTGRFELIHDTTLPARGEEGWMVSDGPYLPGTTVSLLLPWWEAAQSRIGASGR